MTSVTPLSIFIGMTRERGRLPRVLIESLYQHSSAPLAIAPLVMLQLESEGLYRWERDPKQIKEFFHPSPGAQSDGLKVLGYLHWSCSALLLQ